MANATTVTIVDSSMVIADRRPMRGAGREHPVRTVSDALIDRAVRPRLRKKIDRFSQISLMAANDLAAHIRSVENTRVGVFMGNDLAGWNYVYDQLARLIDTRDAAAVNPYVATAWFPAAAQGEITIAYDIVGQSKTFSAGVLSGGLALEYAARALDDGHLEIVLAGGVEAPDATPVLKALTADRRIAPDHPASEAVGLLAVAAGGRNGLAKLALSPPRRDFERSLMDIASVFERADAIACRKVSLASGNCRWRERDDALTAVLRAGFGSRLHMAQSACDGLDAGSATFPIHVAEASRAMAGGPPGLIVGTDFEGLHLAAAVTPISQRSILT